MKKEYMKPTMTVVMIQHQQHLLQASGIHNDDPQTPGSAMSRRFDGWDDE